MSKVFVVDAEGKPLLPTHPARSRKLIREGKASVLRIVPYTIQLNRVVDNPVGSFTVGIDDGAKEVGISVVNEHTKEVVFCGTIQLRQDVSRKITQRRQYRRTRRSRNLRPRKAKFNNREKKGWIPPSIQQKKDSVLRVIEDLKTVLNITKAVVEQGMFDTSSMAAGRKKEGTEYQIPDHEGRDFREKVLWRDRYTCQHCESKDKLRAHHIKLKSRGGTNTPKNGITLCENCHEEFHGGLWVLDMKPGDFKYPAHLQAGKWYLYNQLKEVGMEVSRCFGWMTYYWRNDIGISKSHINDAISMVCRNYVPLICQKEYLIIPRRKKIGEANSTKTCIEKNGFRHWDLVKAKHQTRGTVFGVVRSLKATAITLRTPWDDNFPVSYRKSKVLWRFSGIAYV